jgi:hypothetical protein
MAHVLGSDADDEGADTAGEQGRDLGGDDLAEVLAHAYQQDTDARPRTDAMLGSMAVSELDAVNRVDHRTSPSISAGQRW